MPQIRGQIADRAQAAASIRRLSIRLTAHYPQMAGALRTMAGAMEETNDDRVAAVVKTWGLHRIREIMKGTPFTMRVARLDGQLERHDAN